MARERKGSGLKVLEASTYGLLLCFSKLFENLFYIIVSLKKRIFNTFIKLNHLRY